MRRRLTSYLCASALTLGALVAAGPTGAQTEVDPLIADSLAALDGLVAKAGEHCALRDASDDETAEDTALPYVFCNDGVVPSGGGERGIPVPVAYHPSATGNDWSRLPRPATAEEVAAADATYDLQPEGDTTRITLDLDVTLPPGAGIAREHAQEWPTKPAPRGGSPVVVFMHGCCGGHRGDWEAATIDAGGEKWHHSNAWFASRGYVVINYTARGFRNANDEGSTGTTQLDSRRFEVNDYQYLVGLLVDHDAHRRAQGLPPIFKVNPKKVVAVGGSYGGGFSWLALTDPTWRSPATKTPIRLAAAAPRYGWTDLVEALVPSGHYFDRDPATGRTAVAPTKVENAVSRKPLGVEKQSIVAGLYGTGNAQGTNHTTFPEWMHDAYARLQQGEPYDGDEFVERLATWFLEDRSAYFQTEFWRRVRNGLKIPLFAAVTWTDPLFPTMQSGIAFYNKLTKVAPDYPVQLYLGDYQHFAANKPKEWGDLCGDDHHVCTIEDLTAARVRVGVNTRMNRFLDHFARGVGRLPRNVVSATTTICASNAGEGYPVDEPGIEYRAATWRKLAPDLGSFAWEGGGAATTTTSSAAADPHAVESDPVFRDRQPNKCYTTSNSDAPPGIVQYEDAVEETFTLMGTPLVRLTYEASATNYWLAVRLFDKKPNGEMTLVTRGICRVNEQAAPDVDCTKFELWGNAWTFEQGHTIVLELSQADSPMFRLNNNFSTIAYTEAALELPSALESNRNDFRD
ncbi:MAG: hypothetical protein M3277_04390 [Actinomycetota bacterium]|nr:hypothetical protein [Actinomycetota bacterium]